MTDPMMCAIKGSAEFEWGGGGMMVVRRKVNYYFAAARKFISMLAIVNDTPPNSW